MKIKEKISSVIAILTLMVLVSGFQIDNKVQGSNLSLVNDQTVYAGPCNDNGCVGGTDMCMVVEILWGAFKRTCYTTVSGGPEELAQL
ncbi:MAG TPA: hypothetical protein DD671_14730 [Balneolaceae bacterium]|nr:hypothetical protein [Balneola sp.]HBQ60830.1 hypothetical protein [Balneolaceae bacterium]|tara:strand:- start:51148 stop:51411 length:264 start_codon:yes stop_codon:yes gene_type:complete